MNGRNVIATFKPEDLSVNIEETIPADLGLSISKGAKSK